MADAGWAAGFAIFAWWFSTGAILLLNRLPAATFGWSMAAGSVVSVGGLIAIAGTLGETTVQAAYVGFLGGLVLWGWHELSFLVGFITGPRRAPCPAGATGWARFRMAAATIITHEVAIFATLVGLAAMSWGAENQTALWTFASLWVLRLSAKLNIFLGIPNLTDELLPARLEHLKSYFRIAPMNGLFPVSVTLGTVAAVVVMHPAFVTGAGPFEATAALLVGTLIGLGVLEHWLMVLPVRDAALWRWAMIDTREGRGDGARRFGSAAERAAAPRLKSFQGEANEAKGAALASALVGGQS